MTRGVCLTVLALVTVGCQARSVPPLSLWHTLTQPEFTAELPCEARAAAGWPLSPGGAPGHDPPTTTVTWFCPSDERVRLVRIGFNRAVVTVEGADLALRPLVPYVLSTLGTVPGAEAVAPAQVELLSDADVAELTDVRDYDFTFTTAAGRFKAGQFGRLRASAEGKTVVMAIVAGFAAPRTDLALEHVITSFRPRSQLDQQR